MQRSRSTPRFTSRSTFVQAFMCLPTLVLFATADPYLDFHRFSMSKRAVSKANNKQQVLFCQFDKRGITDDAPSGLKVESLPANSCTDIFVGFFKIDKARLALFSARQRIAIEDMEDSLFSIRKNNPQVRLHLTIGMPDTDSSNSFLLDVLDTEARMKVFLRFTASYLRGRGYDGLNVYWTSVQEKDSKLVWMLKELNSLISDVGLGTRLEYGGNFTISVTVSAFPLALPIDSPLKDTHKYVDFFIVKAFDSNIDSKPLATNMHPHHLRGADLSNEQSIYLEQTYSVSWWEAHGIPHQKIVASYPTYARALLIPPHGSAQQSIYPGSIYSESVIISRGEVCRIHKEAPDGWSIQWDNQWMSYFMKRDKNNQSEWIFYNSRLGIEKRCHWLLKHGYRGLMIWTLNMDDYSGVCGKGKFAITDAGSECLQIRAKTFEEPALQVSGLDTAKITEKIKHEGKGLWELFKTNLIVGIGLVFFFILCTSLITGVLLPRFIRALMPW